MASFEPRSRPRGLVGLVGLGLGLVGLIVGLAGLGGCEPDSLGVDEVEVSTDVSDPDSASATACLSGAGPVGGPWLRCAGGPAEDMANAVVVTPSGEVLVAGSTTSGALRTGDLVVGDTGHASSVVLRYDAAGRPLGARALSGRRSDAEGEVDEAATAVAVDPWGDVIIAGRFTGRLDFGGGIALEARTEQLGEDVETDIYIVKLDPTLTSCRWARQISGFGRDDVNSMVIDASGAVYVTGSAGSAATFGPFQVTQGPFFLAKIGSDGAEAWITDSGLGPGFELALDSEQHVTVVGLANGQVVIAGHGYGGNSPFIVRFAPDGEPEWAREIYGSLVSVYGVGASGDGRDGRIHVGAIISDGASTFDAGDGILIAASAKRLSAVITYDLDGRAESGFLVASAGGLPPFRSFLFGADGAVVVTSRFRGERWLDDETVVQGNDLATSIAGYDREGTLRWHSLVQVLDLGPGLPAHLLDMAFDPSGALLLTGNYPTATNFDGTPLEPVDNHNGSDIWLWKVARP